MDIRINVKITDCGGKKGKKIGQRKEGGREENGARN